MSMDMSNNSDLESEDPEDYNSNRMSKMVVRKQVVNTPISILIESLVKNLSTLLEKDDQRAIKIYNKICSKLYELNLIDESYKMTEYEDIRSQYQRALYHLVTAARGTSELPAKWPNACQFSHYYRQFDELEFIAGGAFGQVYKVQHKLDGSFYAVKKVFICANDNKRIMEYLTEAKTISSLNHVNIVQYKAAWLELGVLTNKKALEPPVNEEAEMSEAVCNVQKSWATLFIQMSLCETNLKQWLNNRNETEQNEDISVHLRSKFRFETIHDILCQMLRGLDYIHSKGIVHHDVKPSNVFIQSENGKLLVQLGDFGLACPLQSSRHSIALGTKMYAAPEQLAGRCDPKSDMFSLGIILLELTDSYLTDMERAQRITELRQGRLPAHISAGAPNLAAIIAQLVVKQPKFRPSATELLVKLDALPADVQQLQLQLRESQAEIARLKAMLKENGVLVD